MSKEETIDYKAVLDDLDRKRGAMNARFDAAIAAIKQVMVLNGSDLQPVLPGLRSLPEPQLASLPYKGMAMAEAAKAHLTTVKRHVPNVELSSALVDGGFEHKSKNFPNTLNSVLRRRGIQVGDVAKSKQGWGLAEWSQGRRRVKKEGQAGVEAPESDAPDE